MPTAVPKKAAIGAMVKSDVASLAKSFQALKQKLADSEAKLESERRERASDADSIAEMLIRIVALERRLHLVDKQLELAERAAAQARGGRAGDRDAALTTLIERLAAARGAVLVDEDGRAPRSKPTPHPGRRGSSHPRRS